MNHVVEKEQNSGSSRSDVISSVFPFFSVYFVVWLWYYVGMGYYTATVHTTVFVEGRAFSKYPYRDLLICVVFVLLISGDPKE